jgi:hypothetical protein
MIDVEKLVPAARARRYDDSEGFLDAVPVIQLEIPERYEEQFEALAHDLARRAGVSLEIAQETLFEEAMKIFMRDILPEE